MSTLDEVLRRYGYEGEAPELSIAFDPGDADRAVAWKVYVELATRVATQPVPPQDGDAETGLTSIASLFQTVRTALASHPEAHLAGALLVWAPCLASGSLYGSGRG